MDWKNVMVWIAKDIREKDTEHVSWNRFLNCDSISWRDMVQWVVQVIYLKYNENSSDISLKDVT